MREAHIFWMFLLDFFKSFSQLQHSRELFVVLFFAKVGQMHLDFLDSNA